MDMESKTSFINIDGTIYIRVPKALAEYFKISDDIKIVIEDITKRKAEIRFSK